MVDVLSFATASTTPGTNASVNGVSILGTGLVSTADDSFRNSLALDAKFYSDLGGTGTVGGSANAITITTPTLHAALVNGMVVSFKNVNGPNTGAVTNNLDAIGAKAIRLEGDAALVGGEMALNGVYLLRYDTAYNSAAGAWVLLNPAVSSVNTTSNDPFINLSLTADANVSVANALKVWVKGADGNDPSPTNPVVIGFRSVTAASGTTSLITLTAATSLVVSSGSTLGMTSGVAATLAVVGFNDAGTFRLGIINPLSNLAFTQGLGASTAEGGAGGADSADTFYTGTAVSSKAYTLLGYITITEATAGTWASGATTIQLGNFYNPVFLSGPFTPTKSGFTETGVGTITLTGHFTRNGSLVTVWVKMVPAGGASVAAVAASSAITGLPFTAANPIGGTWINEGTETQGGFLVARGAALIMVTSWTTTSDTRVFTATYEI